MSDPAAPAPVPVILLGGASGSGKSYLAEHFGRPAFHLDNFYRNIAEDETRPMPRTPYGEIDWDHPDTWNAATAVASVVELVTTGETSVPKYDSEYSTSYGRERIRLGAAPRIVAEGIFVATALPALRDAGLNVTAYYVDVPAWRSTLQRFVRDVKMRRKPLPFLLKRGLALHRADRAMRRAHLEAGFIPRSKRDLKTLLAG